MGPEGGSGGGMVVATGTPEEIVQVKESHTGYWLAPVLKGQISPRAARKQEVA
jgi:excinuclease ABC subunit A